MPDDVRDALAEAKRTDAYEARPAYQRNDYLGWVGQAKTSKTRQKRIDQMISELRKVGVYMGMRHKPSAKDSG